MCSETSGWEKENAAHPCSMSPYIPRRERVSQSIPTRLTLVLGGARRWRLRSLQRWAEDDVLDVDASYTSHRLWTRRGQMTPLLLSHGIPTSQCTHVGGRSPDVNRTPSLGVRDPRREGQVLCQSKPGITNDVAPRERVNEQSVDITYRTC